jgi:hypothetical protein
MMAIISDDARLSSLSQVMPANIYRRLAFLGRAIVSAISAYFSLDLGYIATNR